MYRAALSEAGLPADGDAASLAAAVRAERPGLQTALQEALDDWINCLRNPPDPDAARVREAVNLVDPDPFRTEIRAAVAADDKSALIRLAERPGATDLPRSTAVMLGSALSDQGCYPEAIRVLRAARARYPSELRLLSSLSHSIAQASPNDPVALEESLGCALVAVAVHPDKAFSHYMLGVAYDVYKHDAAAAEPHYRKTLELNPRFTFAMVNLAIRLESKGDVAGMEYWYRKAIETDPKFERPRSNLARSLLNRGDVAGAVAEYRKLIEIAPAYAWGHGDLAGALEQGGDLPAAVAEYRRAAELAPKDTGLRDRLAAEAAAGFAAGAAGRRHRRRQRTRFAGRGHGIRESLLPALPEALRRCHPARHAGLRGQPEVGRGSHELSPLRRRVLGGPVRVRPGDRCPARAGPTGGSARPGPGLASR